MKRRSSATLVIMTVLLVLGTGFSWFLSVWLRVHDDPILPDYVPPVTEPDDPQHSITNILVLGLDSMGNEPGRADVIMVMSINEDTDEVALISIPRDARVHIPGKGLDKINHAMTYKGEIAVMKATMESLLGVPIDHYVYTNFPGFVKIVDILGGVTIDVEKKMVYQSEHRPSFNLSPGLQRLNGDEALGYVRFRGDSKADFGRMQRQQKFLKAVAKEVLQVKQVLKLPQLLEQGARHIRTDMSIPQLLAFARRSNSINLDEVVALTIPGRGTTIQGVSYIELDKEALEDTIKRYLRWEKEISQASAEGK